MIPAAGNDVGASGCCVFVTGGAGADFDDVFVSERVGLLRIATGICGDADVAADVVQEAFTRALVRWRRVGRYESPAGWLRLVTVRLAIRARDRRQREVSTVVDPRASVEDSDRDIDLELALHRLSSDDRAVIVLFYFADLPVEEVARAVGARPGAVRVRLHRARTRLATMLEPLEVDNADR